jgi:hypothetical protein
MMVPRQSLTQLRSSVQKQAFETEKDPLPLLANTGVSVYNQASFTVGLCSNIDTFTEGRSFFYGWCGDPSPAAEG